MRLDQIKSVYDCLCTLYILAGAYDLSLASETRLIVYIFRGSEVNEASVQAI